MGKGKKKGNSSGKSHSWRHVGGPMLISRKDERYGEYRRIQKETGVSPDETWSLDYTVACFVLPRLRAFREIACGYPDALGSMEEWQGILGRMVDAFELIAEDRTAYGDDERRRIEDGLDLFREWFHALWW